MARLGVVVANEPLAHREAIAAAVRVLRPDVIVATVEPTNLAGVVGHPLSQVIICSALTELIRREACYWIVLCPDARAGTRMGLAGREVAREPLNLDELLAVIDEAGRRLLAP